MNEFRRFRRLRPIDALRSIRPLLSARELCATAPKQSSIIKRGVSAAGSDVGGRGVFVVAEAVRRLDISPTLVRVTDYELVRGFTQVRV